jgi:hypothetical protein
METACRVRKLEGRDSGSGLAEEQAPHDRTGSLSALSQAIVASCMRVLAKSSVSALSQAIVASCMRVSVSVYV